MSVRFGLRPLVDESEERLMEEDGDSDEVGAEE